jgi:hypothetical protein
MTTERAKARQRRTPEQRLWALCTIGVCVDFAKKRLYRRGFD